MSVIQTRGKGFGEIAREFEPVLEELISTDPGSGRRVLTADSIRELLSRCDDVSHAQEPLAEAVFGFIMSRDASILLSDS